MDEGICSCRSWFKYLFNSLLGMSGGLAEVALGQCQSYDSYYGYHQEFYEGLSLSFSAKRHHVLALCITIVQS